MPSIITTVEPLLSIFPKQVCCIYFIEIANVGKVRENGTFKKKSLVFDSKVSDHFNIYKIGKTSGCRKRLQEHRRAHPEHHPIIHWAALVQIHTLKEAEAYALQYLKKDNLQHFATTPLKEYVVLDPTRVRREIQSLYTDIQTKFAYESRDMMEKNHKLELAVMKTRETLIKRNHALKLELAVMKTTETLRREREQTRLESYTHGHEATRETQPCGLLSWLYNTLKCIRK